MGVFVLSYLESVYSTPLIGFPKPLPGNDLTVRSLACSGAASAGSPYPTLTPNIRLTGGLALQLPLSSAE